MHCNLLLVISLALAIDVASTSTLLMSNPLLQQDVGCGMVNCGHGNCKATSDSLLGFDCECHPGWRKLKIGFLVIPSCVVPNCTFDFKCFNESQRGQPPHIVPSLNFTDPCGIVWCGHYGKCVTSGTRYSCQCFEGSVNLLNSSALPCFKQCYLGVDCNNQVINYGSIGSPIPSNDISSDSRRNGSAETLSRLLMILHVSLLTLLVVSLI